MLAIFYFAVVLAIAAPRTYICTVHAIVTHSLLPILHFPVPFDKEKVECDLMSALL